jgi:hypothetical protein
MKNQWKKEQTMRYAIIAAAIAATVIAGTASAQDKMGNDEKYCAQGHEGAAHCTFETRALCDESLKVVPGTCIVNPKITGIATNRS